MAKLFATDTAQEVAPEPMCIDGYGYLQEFVSERIYRDARLLSLSEGSSRPQQLAIAHPLLDHYPV